MVGLREITIGGVDLATQRITPAAVRRGLLLSLAVSLAGIVALLFHTTDAKTWQLIRTAAWLPLFAALLAVAVAWLVEAYRLWALLRLLDERIALRPLVRIVLSTAFAAGVTPLASGQGPVQVYLFHREGVSLGKSTAILSIRLLLTTLVYTVTAPLLLLAFRVSVSQQIHLLLNYAVVFSFALSALILLFIVRPHVTQTAILRLLRARWLARHFHPEKIEALMARLVREVDDFREAISAVDERKLPYLLVAVFLTFGYWVLYYLVAPALLLAFHIPYDLTRVMVLQTVFFFILSSVPIPGGSGVAELGFASIFTHIVPGSLLGVFVSLWRLITYYLTLLLGAGTFFAAISPRARD